MNRYLSIVLALLLLTACSRPTTFKIKGTIHGVSNTNIYVKYYGDGAVQTGVTATQDGSFEAEFSSQEPTIVEILGSDLKVLARLYLCNGDEVQVDIDPSNPNLSTATGTEINERWSALINANADLLANGDSDKINDLVADYITAHPDDIVSTLMFATFYDASADPVKADEVMSLISPEARGSVLDSYYMMIKRYADPARYARTVPIRYRSAHADTVFTFRPSARPASLVVVSNESSKRSDSIVPQLKRIYRSVPASKLQIMDFVLFTDTGTMRRVVMRDSASWLQGWVPGGIIGDGLNQLAIPQIPYFIVMDSTGRQVYRGASHIEAERHIKDLTK